MSGRRPWPRLSGLGPALLLCCTLGETVGPEPEPEPPPVALDTRPDVEPRDEPPAEPREPPRVLTDPGSGVSLLWSAAALGAVVTDAEIVVLEPDGRHLGAVDWRTGDARWRIELSATVSAQLYSLGDRVLVHDQDRAVVVEAARGRVLGRHDAPPGRAWPYVHGVAMRRDACAWVGPCGIQVFDCSNGAPRGPYLASSEVHLYGVSDDPSEHSSSCSPVPRLLGRHGSTVALVAAAPRTDEAGRPAGSIPAVLGHDPTGQLLWQQALPSGLAPAGTTEDGTCWVLDEDAPALWALDCETGTVRWERPLGPGRLRAHGLHDDIVIAREHGNRWRLSAYATADGEPSWSTRLAKRQHPVLPGSPLLEAHSTGKRRVYALIDPERGGVAGELVAGRDEELWRDPGGGFVLTGRELREVDAEGRLTRQRPFPGTQIHTVLADHVLTHDGETIEIYDRDGLRERARIEGRMVIEPTTLPSDRVLLRRGGEDGVALLLGLSPPARR